MSDQQSLPPPFNKCLPDPKFELMVLCFHSSRLYCIRLVLHAIYNATSNGENILPVNYQVLQQCPELLVTYFTRNLVSDANHVIR